MNTPIHSYLITKHRSSALNIIALSTIGLTIHSSVLSCESLSREQIKDHYFNAVTSDTERIGILCITKSSKDNHCTQQDKIILSNHWVNFVSNASLRASGPPLIEQSNSMIGDKRGRVKICSYYVRVGYSASNKFAIVEEDLAPITKLVFIEKFADGNSKIGLEANNWVRINVEDITAKNNVGQEWMIAPVAWSIENFRRYILINRASINLHLSPSAKQKINELRDYIEDDSNWKNFVTKFNEAYN
jgi:hypothetical protein